MNKLSDRLKEENQKWVHLSDEGVRWWRELIAAVETLERRVEEEHIVRMQLEKVFQERGKQAIKVELDRDIWKKACELMYLDINHTDLTPEQFYEQAKHLLEKQ